MQEKLSDIAFNEAQQVLWDIREMDDMELDTDYLKVEYSALECYGLMADAIEGNQICQVTFI